MIIQRIPVLQLANKPPKLNQHCYQICHDHIRGVMEAVFWRLAFSCSLTFVSPPPPFPRTYWKSVSSNLFWCCRFWKIEYHIIYNHLEGPIKCDKKVTIFSSPGTGISEFWHDWPHDWPHYRHHDRPHHGHHDRLRDWHHDWTDEAPHYWPKL